MPIRALLLALCALLAAGAVHAAPETAEEIDECVHSNVPDSTSDQRMRFRVTDRSGLVDESELRVQWKKFPDGYWRVLSRFERPHSVRGTALLMHEHDSGTDIFVYLPEFGMVRRINQRTMNGAVAGTNITYEDWERLQGLADDTELTRKPDQQVAGRPVYVIEGRPAHADDTSYTRIVSYVDQETCIVLRSEIYETGDRLRKVVTVPRESIERKQNYWIARRTTVVDPREGSRTEVVVVEIELDVPLSKALFSKTELEAKGR